MKLKFTLFGMSLFLMLSTALLAQAPNILTITSPASIAGDYNISVPDWGGTLTNNMGGTAVFSDDGTGTTTDACENSVADISIKWGVADRGDCNFSLKALHIQNAGGVAAIICNHAQGDADGEGAPQMAAGDDADQVTIPVMGLSYQDCQTIRSIGEDMTFEVRAVYNCGSRDYGPEYIWGTEAGEGDFSNGTGGWTVSNVSNNGWLHETSGALDFGGSNCNGYMSFPTDGYFFNALNGGCAGFDPENGASCNGSIFSPTITLDPASITGGLVCEFNHHYSFWYEGATSLIVSWDNGATWPDTINASAGADLTQIPTPADYPSVDAPCNLVTGSVFVDYFNLKRLPIPYNGQTSIQLQFLHVGNLYSATIDDVALLNLEGYHDIELGQEFVSYAPAFNIPLSQTQEVALHTDLYNVGTTAVMPELRATAFVGNNNTPVFESTFAGYGTQPGGCFLNQNISFPDFYTPDQLGEHTVLIENVTADDAIVNDNDLVGFRFNMTQETWTSTPTPIQTNNDGTWDMFTQFNLGPAETFDANWAVAYPFYIPAGAGQYLNTVRFGVKDRNTNSGNVYIYLMEWVPGDFSFPNGPRGAPDGEPANPGNYIIDDRDTRCVGTVGRVFGFDSPERIPIGPSITDDMNNPIAWEDITAEMVAADDGGKPVTNTSSELRAIALKDQTHYVLVFAMQPAEQVPVDLVSYPTSDRNAVYHGASNFAYASAGRYQRPNAHYSALFDNFQFADVNTIPWTGLPGGTEWGPNTPWIEMEISPVPLFSNTEDLSEEVAQSVSIFPNPVSDNITISVDFPEATSFVQFDMMNVNGELVKKEKYGNVQKGTFNMDVSDLTPGVYTLNTRSEKGFATQKVIIQR